MLSQWRENISKAEEKYKRSRNSTDYQFYALACAAFLTSDEFKKSGVHWFCEDAEVARYATNSLIMFSFKQNDDPASQASRRFALYTISLRNMLSNCRKCVKSYQKSQIVLSNELNTQECIPKQKVDEFMKVLHRHDRRRITETLELDAGNLAALTESLWSISCLSSTTFITEVLEKPFKLLGTEPVCAPGFIVLYFSSDPEIAAIAAASITKNVHAFILEWEDSPNTFIHFLNNALRRNIMALNNADYAWFNAYSLMKIFTKSRKIIESMIPICIQTLTVASGLPAFGAQALMKELLLNLNLRQKDAAKESKEINLDEVEKALDYTCQAKLKFGLINPDSPAASHKPNYEQLSASMVTRWVKEYLQLTPKSALLAKRVEFLASLDISAFKNKLEFEDACRCCLRAVAYRLHDCWPVLMKKGAELSSGFAKFDSESVSRVWEHQSLHCENWSSLWDSVIQNPEFVHSLSLEQEEYRNFTVGVLQGSKQVPALFQLPRKPTTAVSKGSTATQSGTNSSSASSASSSPTNAEKYVMNLLELLTDLNTPETLLNLLKTGGIETFFLIVSSGNKQLSLSGVEFLKSCTSCESKEEAVNALIKTEPDTCLKAVNEVLLKAMPASVEWLAMLPGIVEMATLVLDQFYSTTAGVETAKVADFKSLLHVYWQRSWSLVGNVLLSIRKWAQFYSTVHVKAVLAIALEFCQSLLERYRLIDADLSTSNSDSMALFDGVEGTKESTKEGKNWGEELAQPVIESINKMGDLLQLADPLLLQSALDIMIEILGLMKSFKVAVPLSLSTLFKSLATRKLNSKLSKEQLIELLSSIDMSDSEIEQLMEKKPFSMNLLEQTQKKAAAATQATLNDFFNKSKTLPPIKPSLNQVLPSTPRQMSQIALIKSQLGKKASKFSTGEITVHPERPPGFNPIKHGATNAKTSSKGDADDDDESDDESALKALGAKSKGMEEAENRLKEAYESRKQFRPAEIVVNGSSMTKRAADDKERAKRLMKARMAVQPTELHEQILGWDFFSTVHPFKVVKSVPNVFEDVEEYEQVMAPLLYLEAWENVQKAKEDVYKASVVQLVLGKRVKIDQFIDVYVSMEKEAFNEAKLGESDILVLTYNKDKPKQLLKPEPGRSCLCRLKEGSIKYSKQFIDFQVRLSEHQQFLTALTSGTEVSAVSLGSLRTVEREFVALKSLKYYELKNEVLKAAPTVSLSDKDVDKFKQEFELNTSQALAVSRAVYNQGFSLIQGPPGTGKTKTILAIIKAFFRTLAPVTSNSGDPVKKILVCAPSNAAVDEIVLRLKNDASELNILRIGRMDRIAEQVHDVTLEQKVSKSISRTAEPVDTQLRADHTALVVERNEIRGKLQSSTLELNGDEVLELEKKLRSLSSMIREKNYALDMQRSRLDQANKQKDLAYRREQANILAKAQVVLTTLSASAHPVLQTSQIPFETVVIDEAAQSIELSALIPLKYGCKQCIMVGDPNQLPPTVISQLASRLKYEQSLFVRMYNLCKNNEQAISILDTQFRMHPAISSFPSREFYNSKLKNGPNLAERMSKPWHAVPGLGPYLFFEIFGRHERGSSYSLKNMQEAYSSVELVKYLLSKYSQEQVGTIGVISPYKEQVRVLRDLFINTFGAEVTSFIDFNSIDGFQGQEKDVIILSCVRADSTKSVGFVGDVRRMNVAITRAKSSLWILGDPNALNSNEVWSSLLSDARERNCIVSASKSITRAVQSHTAVANTAGNYSAPRVTEINSVDPDYSKTAQNRPPIPALQTSKEAANLAPQNMQIGIQNSSVSTAANELNAETEPKKPVSSEQQKTDETQAELASDDAKVTKTDDRKEKGKRKAPKSIFIKKRDRRR